MPLKTPLGDLIRTHGYLPSVRVQAKTEIPISFIVQDVSGTGKGDVEALSATLHNKKELDDYISDLKIKVSLEMEGGTEILHPIQNEESLTRSALESTLMGNNLAQDQPRDETLSFREKVLIRNKIREIRTYVQNNRDRVNQALAQEQEGFESAAEALRQLLQHESTKRLRDKLTDGNA